MQQLSGRKVAVVGATSGIGEAMARRFAEEGAQVLIVGRRADQGNALVGELRRAGAQAFFVEADAGSASGAEAIADGMRAHLTSLDALMLNAGVVTYGSLWDLDEDAVDAMLRVNLKAPWLVARACHDLVVDGGSVVVTASVTSFSVYPEEGMYAATKAGVAHLVRAMAQELAPRGVRVNSLCPGVVAEAGMSHEAIARHADSAALEAEYGAATLLGRMASLREVTDAALFLASERSTYVTGTSLVVDGGLLVAP